MMARAEFTRIIARILLPQILLWIVGGGLLLFNNVQPAQAADPDMIIFMDYGDLGGGPPANWEIVSDTTGGSFSDVFYGRYVRASGAYGTQGGAATHTHTLTWVSNAVDAEIGNNMYKKGSGTTASSKTHTHSALANSSINPDDNLPAYRSLAVLRYNSGIPATLPDNAILLFETATISGNWELYSAQDARLLYGNSSTADNGNNTPTHTVASGLNGASGTIAAGTGSGTFASETHTHLAGAGVATDKPSIVPPYYEVVFQRATAEITSFPNNIIAGFSGTAFDSPDWTVVSNTTQKYNNLFLMGDSSGDLSSGGTSTHSHANVTVTTGIPAESITRDNSSATGAVSTMTHTHASLVIQLQANVDHTPLYTNLVLAQYTASVSLGVTAPADVALATGNPGDTTETTWGTGEKVTVTDGGSGWSLTVIMQTTLTSGGYTIPDANVKIRKDGTVGGGGDIYTIWSGTITNITETNATESLDTSRTVGIRSSGTGGDTSEVRPTIQVVIPVGQHPADYTGSMRFTVA